MTELELNELVGDCPVLYHMAEDGSWPSIEAQGLMSTTALLDRYDIAGELRDRIERTRRPACVRIDRDGLPPAVIRDQLPMDDAGLLRALPANIPPAKWYEILNSKVFFWLTRERLIRLMSARAYRNKRHDVIEINTARLVSDHFDSIWLCPMNSGCTKPMPHKRGPSTFTRISDYPYDYWKTRRPRGERAVELAVDYEVADIARYVRRVVSMQAGAELAQLYVAP